MMIRVSDPKERIVSAAPFRDRVVHHALCATIQPIIERGFIANSFTNRVGKGAHKAIEAYERYRDRHQFVLRGDPLIRRRRAANRARPSASSSGWHIRQLRFRTNSPKSPTREAAM